MAKFVYTYRGGAMPETDEERAASMAAWGAWLGGMGPSALDPGNPFGASATVGPGGGGGLGGYSIVSAESLEAATAMAEGCPVLTAGGSVDVHEVIEIM